MRKLAFAIFAGLVGAIIVHIVTLLLIPVVSQRDIWSRLSASTKPGIFTVIDPNGKVLGASSAFDPNFVVGTCQFSLKDGPLLLSANGKTSFWSLSVFNKRGENLFSINDRIANNGLLDMVVATPLQFIEFQNDMPDEMQNSVFAQLDIDEGFVILRAFVPTASERKRVKAFLETSLCQTL